MDMDWRMHVLDRVRPTGIWEKDFLDREERMLRLEEEKIRLEFDRLKLDEERFEKHALLKLKEQERGMDLLKLGNFVLRWGFEVWDGQ